MNDFGINEMLEMQKALQEKYKDKWEGISPEIGKNKLLWMVGEIGEVIDVIKKNGDHKVCEEGTERSHLVEELADVLSYINKIDLCALANGVMQKLFAALEMRFDFSLTDESEEAK